MVAGKKRSSKQAPIGDIEDIGGGAAASWLGGTAKNVGKSLAKMGLIGLSAGGELSK
jgi:hypothetical protein